MSAHNVIATIPTPPATKLTRRAKPIGWMVIPFGSNGEFVRNHRVSVYARRNGLAITAAPRGEIAYRITHIASGRRLSRDFRTLTEARDFLRRTAPLCDWTLPRELLGSVAIAVSVYERECAAMQEADNA